MPTWSFRLGGGAAVVAFGAGCLIAVYNGDVHPGWIAFQLVPFVLVGLAALTPGIPYVGVVFATAVASSLSLALHRVLLEDALGGLVLWTVPVIATVAAFAALAMTADFGPD